MKVVTAETMTKLLERAAMAPRRRISLNLHPETSDPINRFLNAGLAGTYVRPHRHRTEKWELLTILYGKLDVVIFDINGRITNRVALSPQDRCLIEIPGGQWHSFIFRPAVVL